MDKSDAAAETREWLEALNSVQAYEGVERVDDLLSEVVSEARKNGAQLPFAWNTAYINTIPGPTSPSLPASARSNRRSAPRSAGTPPPSC